MRIIVYGRPIQNRVLAAFVEGCKALGHVPVQRSAAVFTPDQTEDVDMVCVYGWKGTAPAIAEAYRAKNVPCVVMDAAYILRDRGYHAVGIGGLNAVPPFACPTDRLNAWGEFAPAAKGSDVLIVGQVQGDAQLPHGFNAFLWAAEAAKEARQSFPSSKIVWKPHPSCEGMDCRQADETRRGSLAESLDGCSHIVTYNSTSAYEAMMRGVKVVCDPSAVYAAHVDNPLPFLARVAYAQWTTEEIASGACLRFLTEGVAYEGHDERKRGDEGQRDERTSADVSRNAETARGNDAGRKTRNARKKGVK